MRYDDDKVRPISKMLPHMRREGQSWPINVYLTVSDIIEGRGDNDKALDLMLKLFGNNKFIVTNNGSFHEYNISIWTPPIKGYFYNKYTAADNDYAERKKYYRVLPDGSYVSDNSVIFIPDQLYDIYMKYDVPWHLENTYENHTPENMDPNYNMVRRVSVSELPDLIEKETVKAVRNWELSRENYNESIERPLVDEGEEILIDDDADERGMSRMSEVLLLHGKSRYNSPEVRPKNWNGSAWV